MQTFLYIYVLFFLVMLCVIHGCGEPLFVVFWYMNFSAAYDDGNGAHTSYMTCVVVV